MIWKLVFVSLKLLIGTIINLIPAIPSLEYDLSQLILFIRKGMYFTNSSVFSVCVSVFVTVEFSLFTWNVIKFVYSKIPFLNIR